MKRQLRLLLVEDEQPSIDLLCYILKEIGRVEIVGTFKSPSQALSNLMDLQPDVAFLDIEMPGINGLELGRQMKAKLPELFIVYITGYSQYALDAYKVKAVDYILKPFMPNEIETALIQIEKYMGTDLGIQEGVETNFRIRCFGDFHVSDGQGQRVKWSTKKTQELLAYLLFNRNVLLYKERISEALWAEKLPNRQTNNLHISLFRLRKDLAQAQLPITISSEKGSQEGYAIQIGTVTCDLDRVNDYIDQSNQFPIDDQTRDFHERHIQILEQEFFKGMDYLWCDLPRENYQRVFIEGQKKMAIYYLAKSEWGSLEKAAESLIIRLPFDEQAYVWLFEALGQTGQKSRLIDSFTKMRRLFRDELGLSPDQEVVKSYNFWL